MTAIDDPEVRALLELLREKFAKRPSLVIGLRVGEETGHDYVSTACQHDRHEECRLRCKFCPAPCGCACHARAA